MNNKTVNSVRSALRHLALGTVVGTMMIAGVACGGSPEPTPSASSSTTTSTTTTSSETPAESGSPTSSTGTQGASETVTVTDTGAESNPTPAGSPKPGGQPLVRPVQQQITRDPFVNPMNGGMPTIHTTTTSTTTTTHTTPTTTTPTVTANNGGTGKGGGKGQEVEEEVPPPDVTVTGIVQGTSGSMAIINGPERSYIGRVGDSLAEYKILSISPKAVTFGFKGHKFKVKMQEEFGSGATGTKATPQRKK